MNQKHVFVVVNIDTVEPNKYGGVFSTREYALERAVYLRRNYDGDWIVRQIIVDWYVDNVDTPPDTL